MNWPTALLSLGAVLLLANPALSDPTLTSTAHETFLKRVDAALACREPRQICRGVRYQVLARGASSAARCPGNDSPQGDRSFATEISPLLRSFIKTRLRHVTCNGYGDQ
jgi:hypothetical protein